MTLQDLFIVCSHGRRSAHETEWVHDPPGSFFKSGEWCPGGRPATLEDLGGEKVWFCVPRQMYDHAELAACGIDHVDPRCGWGRIFIPLPDSESVGVE